MDGLALSPGTVAAFSRFALWVANGSVGNPLLKDTDYSDVLNDASCMEQVYAIFGNVLRLDASGEPINYQHAQGRAALYLYAYCNGWENWPESDPMFTSHETKLPSSDNVI
jgi:hypothetical protein